jgi:hypothetical protein
LGRMTIEAQTSIRPLDQGWVVSVTNGLNPLERWEKVFHFGLDAYTEAFKLRLISKLHVLTASPLAVANRHYSESSSEIDPDVLVAEGFKPRSIEYGYRISRGLVNQGGEIFQSFSRLPSPGDIFAFDQGDLIGPMKVVAVAGPYDYGGSIRFILDLEPV